MGFRIRVKEFTASSQVITSDYCPSVRDVSFLYDVNAKKEEKNAPQTPSGKSLKKQVDTTAAVSVIHVSFEALITDTGVSFFHVS